MFDINQIYKADNFLTKPEQQAFATLCSHYKWELLGASYNIERIFWVKDLWESDLGKCEGIESTFRIKLQEILGVQLLTERLYLNGQAHGQCGSVHVDNDSEDDNEYITAVYYVKSVWSPEYGGFTVILEKDETTIKYINYPEPNSIVVFNSKLPHVGLEPSAHCKSQRVTLAHKFKVIK
jgi:Rps23 Pro-64 3,4-dihydroxylase Tpa1-like proline 4-hydroxylase